MTHTSRTSATGFELSLSRLRRGDMRRAMQDNATPGGAAQRRTSQDSAGHWGGVWRGSGRHVLKLSPTFCAARPINSGFTSRPRTCLKRRAVLSSLTPVMASCSPRLESGRHNGGQQRAAPSASSCGLDLSFGRCMLVPECMDRLLGRRKLRSRTMVQNSDGV